VEGLVRADPVGAEVLTVADISCNAHYAFPNAAATAGVARLDPDLLAFTGDQYYESSGASASTAARSTPPCSTCSASGSCTAGRGASCCATGPASRSPTTRRLSRQPLGRGGGGRTGADSAAEAKGGYKMMAEFVNVVHRIQTSHHPDSPARPGKRGIGGYYGPLTYGRVSFAILADRQYKSGPDGKVPRTTSGRADHVVDPDFDPRSADLPGLELLGGPQLEFLRAWARDWRGAEMKAAISQTLFTAMATHHGRADGVLVADYDTNAWPQAARDAAVRELRRAFAFHLAGDQHLPAVVHYGIDAHRDGRGGLRLAGGQQPLPALVPPRAAGGEPPRRGPGGPSATSGTASGTR
jgi:hypothetical protein